MLYYYTDVISKKPLLPNDKTFAGETKLCDVLNRLEHSSTWNKLFRIKQCYLKKSDSNGQIIAIFLNLQTTKMKQLYM